MPERKEPLFNTSFIKGLVLGWVGSTFLNKYAIVGAVLGIAAGISSEQADPKSYSDYGDKVRKQLQTFRDLYNDESDDDRWSVVCLGIY